MEVCETCNIDVPQQQSEAVELNTKLQSKPRLWFGMRTERITASCFKAASHTNPAAPSISLIMSVCYPEMSQFTTAATLWGVSMRKVRERSMKVCHQ